MMITLTTSSLCVRDKSSNDNRESDEQMWGSSTGRSTRNQPASKPADLFQQSRIARVAFNLNNEAAPHDCGVGVLPDFSNVFRGRDAEPDGDRQISESPHSLNEIRGGFRQVLSNPGYPRSRDRVYEPAAGLAHELDALVGAGGRNEKDQINSGIAHRGSKLVGFFGHEISREHSVDACASKLVAEPIQPDRKKRIQVAEEDYRDFALPADTTHEVEAVTDADVFGERPLRGTLNHRTIRHRIRERHAEFNNVSSTAFELEDYLLSGFERWIARRDVRDETLTSRPPEFIELCFDSRH